MKIFLKETKYAIGKGKDLNLDGYWVGEHLLNNTALTTVTDTFNVVLSFAFIFFGKHQLCV